MPSEFKPSPAIFGQRLREARKRFGLPQDKLGVVAGLDEGCASARMSRYESGLHMPDLPFAQRLAHELNVPDAFLFTNDDLLAELILGYGQLTAPLRRDLEAYAKTLLADGKATALTGVPVVVKDNILVKGEKATAASKILEEYVSVYDATAVRKLKEAGAILLGRANMDEFAMGGSTENSAYGVTKNPHDLTRMSTHWKA